MFYFVILTYLPNEPCFTLPDLRSSQMIYVLPRHMYVSPPINHVLSRHIYGSPQMNLTLFTVHFSTPPMNHILPNPINGTPQCILFYVTRLYTHLPNESHFTLQYLRFSPMNNVLPCRIYVPP